MACHKKITVYLFLLENASELIILRQNIRVIWPCINGGALLVDNGCNRCEVTLVVQGMKIVNQ